MNRTVIILLLIGAIVSGSAFWVISHRTSLPFAGKEKPRLFPVCDRCGSKDGRWGYIDSTGKLAINFQFEEVADFSEGLAAVKTGNRWGFIDEDGKFAINPQFDKVGGFAEGLVQVNVGRQWGYADKTGKYAINPQFDLAGMFSDGLAMVMSGGKWGYIDKGGKYVINPQFDDAWWFSEGVAAVKIGDKWGYIDKKGKYLINPQFDETSDTFSEGRSAFRIGDKWGYIDEDGKYVINPQFDSAGKFSEGLAVVQSGDKWGYVDRNGKYTISPQFAKAEGFSEGFAAVRLGDKWGYIDKDGKIVINPQFNGASVGIFRRGLAMIAPNLYINAKAEWVWPSPKLFQSDFAQIAPLLSADRPSSTENDGSWNLCANNIATRPLCFTLRKGDATEYGKVLFHDRKAAQVAAKLQFDELSFEDEHGGTLFAMKPTADGWVPFPGIPAQPFMLETVPDLPSLPDAGNGVNGTPVTPEGQAPADAQPSATASVLNRAIPPNPPQEHSKGAQFAANSASSSPAAAQPSATASVPNLAIPPNLSETPQSALSFLVGQMNSGAIAQQSNSYFHPGTGGVVYPVCVYCPDPKYPEEARKAKVQGTVVLQAVITAEGRATDIQVVKGPGHGLEEVAIEDVKDWRFKPAIGPNGEPVAVPVPIEITFRLLK